MENQPDGMALSTPYLTDTVTHRHFAKAAALSGHGALIHSKDDGISLLQRNNFRTLPVRRHFRHHEFAACKVAVWIGQ